MLVRTSTKLTNYFNRSPKVQTCRIKTSCFNNNQYLNQKCLSKVTFPTQHHHKMSWTLDSDRLQRQLSIENWSSRKAEYTSNKALALYRNLRESFVTVIQKTVKKSKTQAHRVLSPTSEDTIWQIIFSGKETNLPFTSSDSPCGNYP